MHILPLKQIEYRVYGDLIMAMDKFMFQLLRVDYSNHRRRLGGADGLCVFGGYPKPCTPRGHPPCNNIIIGNNGNIREPCYVQYYL